MNIPDSYAYLNGRFAPVSALNVSVMDRGFLFGDGVYEVIPVYGRHPFRLKEHLARLGKSLAAVRITNPHTQDEWFARIMQIVAQQGFDDQSLYVQVSRGVAWPRNHAFPEQCEPTVFIYAEPLSVPSASAVQNGVRAVSAQDTRWAQCHIKTTSLVANILLKQRAADVGADEVILFRDGQLIEGGASNVFVVQDGVLLAPPPSPYMLTGITYDVVLELAQRHDMAHAVRPISEQEAREADEMWISSSSKEILAVTQLDQRPIGKGQPGPIYRRIYDYYQHFKTAEMRP